MAIRLREPDKLQVRADQFIEAEYPSLETSADDGFEDDSLEDDGYEADGVEDDDFEDEGDDGFAADDFEDDFEDDDFGRVRFLDDYRDNDYLGQPLSVPVVGWFPREEFAAALELWPLFKQK